MPLDLDVFIDRHLHWSPTDIKVKYDVEELHELVKMSIRTFQNEGSLVKINAPSVIVGDLHGQYFDLLRLFSMCKHKNEENRNVHGALSNKFVFLGNYIGSDPRSLETLCLVLALKTLFPTKYAVLRGNNESENISRSNGFRDDLLKRFGEQEGEKLFNGFNDVFSWMPLACNLGTKILCIHGGLSPHLKSLEDIEKIARPLKDIKKVPLALDLLCADPMIKLDGFRPNTVRGMSCFFGEEQVLLACKNMGLSLIVRSHQAMSSGFGSFADRKLMTIFSAPAFEKYPEINEVNAGAALSVKQDGKLALNILKPIRD